MLTPNEIAIDITSKNDAIIKTDDSSIIFKSYNKDDKYVIAIKNHQSGIVTSAIIDISLISKIDHFANQILKHTKKRRSIYRKLIMKLHKTESSISAVKKFMGSKYFTPSDNYTNNTYITELNLLTQLKENYQKRIIEIKPNPQVHSTNHLNIQTPRNPNLGVK